MRRCFYHTEGGVSGESTVTTSIFLAFRELKIATNCTIKQGYTD